MFLISTDVFIQEQKVIRAVPDILWYPVSAEYPATFHYPVPATAVKKTENETG